ncbi:Aldo/keto reductase [Cadophora sp. DSE1049]|nr:Aldo/keto reductase [Cadophora sp. DSE1049]
MASSTNKNSLLRRHRLLAPSASVFVSPLCLGGMNFGDSWQSVFGQCDKTTTFDILDTFYDMGGNFIDTSNNYQSEESETWIGEWMAKTPHRRDEMVIATKYAEDWKTYSDPNLQQSNYGGNSTKSLHLSIAASLAKLQTTYVDLLYVHFWDYTTSIEEVMMSLNVLVNQGKVLYLGISNTPAWIVVKCNEFARAHSMKGFSVYQGQWSAATRDLERDIVPMCRAEGMGLAPWGVLGNGYFKKQSEPAAVGGRDLPSLAVGREGKVSLVLEKIATAKDTALASVALAYIMHKAPYIFPVIGGRKKDHLLSNIKALGLHLSNEEVKEIDGAYSFDMGFPHNLLSEGKIPLGPQDVGMTGIRGDFDFVKAPTLIQPHI